MLNYEIKIYSLFLFCLNPHDFKFKYTFTALYKCDSVINIHGILINKTKKGYEIIVHKPITQSSVEIIKKNQIFKMCVFVFINYYLFFYNTQAFKLKLKKEKKNSLKMFGNEKCAIAQIKSNQSPIKTLMSFVTGATSGNAYK